MEHENIATGPSTAPKENEINHQVLLEKLESIENRLIRIEEILAKPLIDGTE